MTGQQQTMTVSEVKDTSVAFTSKFKASSFKPAEPVEETPLAAADDDDDGEPMDEGSDVDGIPVEDVDGDPIGADMDGEPMDDVDGAPMEDVDGDPIGTGDVDGDPMDDDLDGAPLS